MCHRHHHLTKAHGDQKRSKNISHLCLNGYIKRCCLTIGLNQNSQKSDNTSKSDSFYSEIRSSGVFPWPTGAFPHSFHMGSPQQRPGSCSPVLCSSQQTRCSDSAVTMCGTLRRLEPKASMLRVQVGEIIRKSKEFLLTKHTVASIR